MTHAHGMAWTAGPGWDPWLWMSAGRGGRGGPPGFGPGHRMWRGRFGAGWKRRRGDVRAAVLVLLAEGPRNGYQIIQDVAERSDDVWRPSAGSVYPALQQLEDEGLTRAVESGTRRVFELTDEGRAHVEAHRDELGTPWEAVAGEAGGQGMEVRDLVGQVAMAAVQVVQAGSASQAEEVRRILIDARRSLYRILAEEGDGADGAVE